MWAVRFQRASQSRFSRPGRAVQAVDDAAFVDSPANGARLHWTANAGLLLIAADQVLAAPIRRSVVSAYGPCSEVSVRGLAEGTAQLSGAQSGLIGNWHFDDGSGTAIADSAGNHHDAALSCPRGTHELFADAAVGSNLRVP